MSLLERRRQHHKLPKPLREIVPVKYNKEKTMTAMDTLIGMSRTHGTFAMPEAKALIKAVRELPEKSIAVVLGSGPGTATIAILLARPDITVFSIDLDDAATERLHAKRLGYMPRLKQIRGHTVTVGTVWTGTQIDLLFVDACHAYQCVKKDNQTWLPFLKTGGIVWFHDYGTENGMWWEVKTAVDQDMAGQQQVARVNASIAFKWNPDCAPE